MAHERRAHPAARGPRRLHQRTTERLELERIKPARRGEKMKHARSFAVLTFVVLAWFFAYLPALGAEVRGKIKSIDAPNSRFVLTEATGKDFTFEANGTSKDRLSSLKAGDSVKVSYEVQGGKIIATSIDRN
jgi:hypothetical protein